MPQPESGLELISGLVRFQSLPEMRKFIKVLLDSYQRDMDRSSNIVGSLLRDKDKKGEQVIQSRRWVKTGNMFVNSAEPGLGTMESIFLLMDEMKPRVAKTAEVLKTFDLLEELPVNGEATYLLLLRAGVPERVIVDSTSNKSEEIG